MTLCEFMNEYLYALYTCESVCVLAFECVRVHVSVRLLVSTVQ